MAFWQWVETSVGNSCFKHLKPASHRIPFAYLLLDKSGSHSCPSIQRKLEKRLISKSGKSAKIGLKQLLEAGKSIFLNKISIL